MNSNNLFHNALLRSTVVYLCIIMVISFVFSISLYSVSSQELERSLKGPLTTQEKRVFGQGRPLEDFIDIQQEREENFISTQNRLRGQLILINTIILVSGGGLSYLLAKRTLQPIEQAHDAQSRFTADASHELRTPITAMRAETELTLTEPKLTLADARKQLVSNMEELDKLTNLSEGLLQLARIDNNGLETESVSVEHIIQQAIDRIMKKTELKKQNITTDTVQSTEIRVNQLAMVEALVTLLDNASKYSPESAEIKIVAKQHAKSVEISVADKGVGIKATELPHIFDRFYRADSSRTKSGEHGYGIGLSIAKSVIDAHGGKISAKSTPGKGSTFTITLPK